MELDDVLQLGTILRHELMQLHHIDVELITD